MRTSTFIFVVAATCAGCGKGDKGSGGSGAAEGSGSAAAGSDTATPPAGSGAAPATFSQTISAAGVGPLNENTDPKTIGSSFPGLEVKTKHDEAEDHSADTTMLLQGGVVILGAVVDNTRSDKDLFRIDVFGSRFATAAGIRVGSTVADFVGAYPDASCTRATYAANWENLTQALMCEAPNLPNVAFYLNPSASPGPDGKVATAKLASLKFERIIWLSPKQHATPAGETVSAAPAGQPFCFPPNTDVVIDRLVATDDAATFCAQIAGKTSCVTASLATGELKTAATVPDKPAEPSVVLSPDGTKTLHRTAKGIEILETKTLKPLQTLTPSEGEFKCVDGARYLGDEIFAIASNCDKPRAAGFLYDKDGKQIGQKIDGINLQDARAFRIKGARYAFHSADSEKVLVLDAATGDAGVVELLSAQQVSSCCEVHPKANVAPFALTPKGKVVTIGASLAVVDLGSGKAEHAWLLPACKK